MPTLSTVANVTGSLDATTAATATGSTDNPAASAVAAAAAAVAASSSSADDWLELNASSAWLLSNVLPADGDADGDSLLLLNDTSSSSLSPSPTASMAAGRFCDEWQAAQMILFQTANLCYALAFLVPHRYRMSGLFLRTSLSAASLLFALWAGVYICAPDIFVWHLAFLLINATHALYLCVRLCPPRVHPELRELYAKLFVPLKMEKKDFKLLVGDARILALDEGAFYAEEYHTSADDRLSILLSGRLKVTYEDAHLHYIYPHQFVDSPEFEASPTGSEQLFQVSITAVEPCRYLCWQRRRLQQVLKMNHFLEAVVYNLVGKDITYKLYSLNETLHPRAGGGPRPSGDWSAWREGGPRSLSADAVHTGTQGQVRSHLLPPHLRNNSAYDSLGEGGGSANHHHNSTAAAATKSLLKRFVQAHPGGYELMTLQTNSNPELYTPDASPLKRTLRRMRILD